MKPKLMKLTQPVKMLLLCFRLFRLPDRWKGKAESLTHEKIKKIAQKGAVKKLGKIINDILLYFPLYQTHKHMEEHFYSTLILFSPSK